MGYSSPAGLPPSAAWSLSRIAFEAGRGSRKVSVTSCCAAHTNPNSRRSAPSSSRNELALKAKICAVSPYLLLLRSEPKFSAKVRDIDFSEFRTLDAVDLPPVIVGNSIRLASGVELGDALG